jgi:hypothetical protein
MKKKVISIIALTVFAIMSIQSCNNSPSKLEKFMGKWKRVDKSDNDTLIIKKEEDAIVMVMGKNKDAAVYNKEKNTLKLYFIADSSIVSYIEKTDHIIGPGNNDKQSEYERVK